MSDQTYDRHALNVAAWIRHRDNITARASAELDLVTDPVARAVLDLHKRVQPDDECHGCPPTGEYSDDFEPWPCRTVRTIAAVLGIEFPKYDGWADDPDFNPLAPIPGYPSVITTTEGEPA